VVLIPAGLCCLGMLVSLTQAFARSRPYRAKQSTATEAEKGACIWVLIYFISRRRR